MSDDVLIRAEGVSKKFCRSLKRSLWYGAKDIAADLVGKPGSTALRPAEFWAVEDVSFELRRGECLGLIGRNGAGKTTVLKMLNGLIKPDQGRIEMRGRVLALIALGAGFNPILTGRENVYINGAVLGLSKRDIDARFDDIVDFAEISESIDAPVLSYSSGMQVRLGFAVATAMEPDVLLLDEVLAVGDRAFRSKCMARISKHLETAAVVIVSHDDAHIRLRCDRVLWMTSGKVSFDGGVEEGLALYASTIQPKARQALFIEPPITSVAINAQTDDEQSLAIILDVECTTALLVDYAIATIESITGQPVCQSIPSGLPLALHAEVNRFEIRFERLHLAAGTYHFSLTYYRNSGKQLLFNFLFATSFTVNGNSHLWTSYQPPVKIVTLNSASSEAMIL